MANTNRSGSWALGVLIALCSSLLGVTLVLKRFSLIGDGLSHVAFGAMAIATILNLTHSMPLILGITMVCAVLILRNGQNAKINGDAAVAMLSVGSLALGYLLINRLSTSSNISADVCSTLFGSTSILTLRPAEVWLCVALSILVVAAFASIVANTFKATYTADGAIDYAASSANASTAIISIMFILMAILFGFFVYRRNAPLGIATIIGVIGIAACMYIGLNWHPIYLSYNVWMIIVGLYIAVASVTPVWILLQPRDYLSSFLLYGMIILAIVGIIGAHPTVDMPAFTGFYDNLKPSGTSLGYLFPALFVTIACGAVSGFHSLVGSGTTAKQLDQEKDAKPIAYGGMLIECALALISVCAVGYIWAQYKSGETTTPTVVFATGLASMFSKVFGDGCYNVVYSMLILAVSAFCLTSVDTATRLARYMFQELFTPVGQDSKSLTGWRKVITNPYVATVITVVAGVALGLTGYAKIWALFGAANQLLAALGLLAVCCWLGKIGRNNKMFYFPMLFMLIVTLTSLAFTIKAQITGIIAGGEGVAWCYIRGIIGVLLVILAIDLVVEGIRALGRNKKAAQAAK